MASTDSAVPGAPTSGFISPEQRQKMRDIAQELMGSPMPMGQSGNFQANSWLQVLGKMAMGATAQRYMQQAAQGDKDATKKAPVTPPPSNTGITSPVDPTSIAINQDPNATPVD